MAAFAVHVASTKGTAAKQTGFVQAEGLGVVDDALVAQWRPLAYRLANIAYRKYPHRYASIEDVEQEAMIGLLNGLRLYRPDNEEHATLMSYLYVAIFRHLQRAQFEGHLIHVPLSIVYEAIKPEKETDTEHIVAARKGLRKPTSMPKFPGFGKRDEHDPPAPAEELKDYEELYEIILETLPERWQFVMMQYFGLGGERRKTLMEISVLLGVTKERVRQIKCAALERMKKLGGKKLESLA